MTRSSDVVDKSLVLLFFFSRNLLIWMNVKAETIVRKPPFLEGNRLAYPHPRPLGWLALRPRPFAEEAKLPLRSHDQSFKGLLLFYTSSVYVSMCDLYCVLNCPTRFIGDPYIDTRLVAPTKSSGLLAGRPRPRSYLGNYLNQLLFFRLCIPHNYTPELHSIPIGISYYLWFFELRHTENIFSCIMLGYWKSNYWQIWKLIYCLKLWEKLRKSKFKMYFSFGKNVYTFSRIDLLSAVFSDLVILCL